MYVYKGMYVNTPALEAAATTVFIVWLRAYLHRVVFTTFRTYVLPTSSEWVNLVHVDTKFCHTEDGVSTICQTQDKHLSCTV